MPGRKQQLVAVQGELDELTKLLPATMSAVQQRRIKQKLVKWAGMAAGAYAPNTLRAWRSDWRVFAEFSQRRGLAFLPASADTVRLFVLERAADGRKVSTIRRNTASITRMHKAAGYADPVADEAVRLAKREIARKFGSDQKQARGFVWEDVSLCLNIIPECLRDYRDRAMAAVAYDAACRGDEIVRLDVEDVAWESDGSATARIRRSKTDQEGVGATFALMPDTVRELKTWLQRSGIRDGAIFRRVIGYSKIGDRLSVQSFDDVMQRVEKWIRQPGVDGRKLSAHSARVGATQDMLANNIDVASVMQAGRWKDSRMVARYGERVLAKRGAMARLAKAQGRA